MKTLDRSAIFFMTTHLVHLSFRIWSKSQIKLRLISNVTKHGKDWMSRSASIEWSLFDERSRCSRDGNKVLRFGKLGMRSVLLAERINDLTFIIFLTLSMRAFYSS